MFQKLDDVEKRYDELTVQISDPEVIARTNEWQKLMKEHSDMTPIVEKYREYKKTQTNYKEALEIMETEKDKEMKDLAEMEMLEAKEKLPILEEELKFLLIPKDPDDDKNVICEIRGGAGGEEAALFAGTLFRMYTMYAESKHWKLEILNENETGLGGYKEISFMVKPLERFSAQRTSAPFFTYTLGYLFWQKSLTNKWAMSSCWRLDWLMV